MHAVLVGTGSEIAQNLAVRLEADGWTVEWRSRRLPVLPAEERWDMLLLCAGVIEPIGKFFDTDTAWWEEAVRGNGLDPLRALRALWPQAQRGAKIVFLGGPNMENPNESYSAYRCGKSILDAIAATLNAEYPEHNFHVFNPGVVKTKILNQILAAGDRAANIARVRAIMAGDEPTVPHDEVYVKLKAIIA